MVDIKKWMTKVSDALKPTSYSIVTLPFTPTSNGLLLVYSRTTSAGRAYIQFNNTMPDLVDYYQIAQGYNVTPVLVTKGRAVSTKTLYNIASTSYVYLSKVGGVLHSSIFKAFSRFTSSRIGGGVDVGRKEANLVSSVANSQKGVMACA